MGELVKVVMLEVATVYVLLGGGRTGLGLRNRGGERTTDGDSAITMILDSIRKTYPSQS